jgi:membrane protease YdiL (CAAX protease family)
MIYFALIVIAWIPLRLVAGFIPGLVCDAILVASWLNLHVGDNDAFDTHINWKFLPVYCACGYILYRLSSLALRSTVVRLSDLRTACKINSPLTTLRFCVITPLHEEITWRVAAQALLGSVLGPLVALIILSIIFSIWHRTVLYSPLQAIELFCFAAILGGGIVITSDPLLPICLHAVRNLFVLTGYNNNAAA